MRKQISSASTGFYKYFYPASMLLILIVGNLYSALAGGGSPVSVAILLTLSSIFALYVVLWAVEIKFVEIVDKKLVVKERNGTREIEFGQIVSVTQKPWARMIPESVTLRYRENGVSRKIRIIPEQRSFGVLEHPLVEELKTIFGLRLDYR